MNVVFDLDGTLLNTIDDLGYACNYALEKRGYPTHPISAIEAMVGNGINMLIRRALPEEVRTDELVAELRKDFVQYYNAHNCDYTRPYPGIEELLHELKAKGHHLAVASNKYHEATEKIIDHFSGIFCFHGSIKVEPCCFCFRPQFFYSFLDFFSACTGIPDESAAAVRTFFRQSELSAAVMTYCSIR